MTDDELIARAETLHLNEMNDPPTIEQMRLFLSDPEIDFTPKELVKWLRELTTRTAGDHRHCAGCPLCSDLWVLEHSADYLELACILIDAAANRLSQLVGNGNDADEPSDEFKEAAKTNPTLAAVLQAHEFRITLSSTEAAYIADAVLAASGLRRETQ